MPPGPVRRLPADTASAVRAHARLASIERIALELADHALACGATRLEIQMDVTRWHLACLYNGQDESLRTHGYFLDWQRCSFDQAPIMACLPWLGLLEVHTGAERPWTVIQRDHHVLYAGKSTKRPKRETHILVHDLWWRMPVRRHMARRRERRIVYRIRQALLRRALQYPQVQFRAPGLLLRPTNHVQERVRALIPTFKEAQTVHTHCTFSAEAHVWQATLHGVVGRAAESLRCLYVNGELVPCRPHEAMAWMSTCPMHVPWLPELARVWDDSTRLYQHVARCLPSDVSVYVLHVQVERRSAPGAPLADWYALLSRLLPKPPMPFAQPRVHKAPRTRSRYFPQNPPQQVPRMVRVDTVPPSLPLLLPSALPAIRVLAQVDHKYVVCACGDTASESLSLLCLDQHAMDERVRLEALTRSYVRACQQQQGHSTPLSEPVRMHTVPPADVRAVMAFWGWDLHIDSASTCSIHAVPHVLSSLRPRPASELATSAAACAAWLAETGARAPWEHDGTPLAALRCMPLFLRQALASHACHTAIRFHQPLAHEQMERLLGQWSETALPFQCAHGRYV